MARTKQKKPTVRLHTLTLTPDAVEALQIVRSDASDWIGRRCSGSAVIRALLRLAQQEGAEWIRAHVCPSIEAEMQQGLMWGKERRVK